MNRKGKGSAYSSSVRLVIMLAASTQSIPQLPDSYYLVISYKCVLIYNKHCNQCGISLVLFKYTLQTICAIPVYVLLAKFTTLC